MLYKQKDIVMVPFLFTDASTEKKRPVLIISNDHINRDYQNGDFVGIAITTTVRQTPYTVQIDKSNLESGDLPQQSLIQCSKFATILKSKVIKRLGTIDDKTFSAVKANVLAVIKN